MISQMLVRFFFVSCQFDAHFFEPRSRADTAQRAQSLFSTFTRCARPPLSRLSAGYRISPPAKPSSAARICGRRMQGCWISTYRRTEYKKAATGAKLSSDAIKYTAEVAQKPHLQCLAARSSRLVTSLQPSISCETTACRRAVQAEGRRGLWGIC